MIDVKHKLLLFAYLTLCLQVTHCLGSKRTRPSARTLAARTGAAQFEEYLDSAEIKGKINKRLANDPDVTDEDREYQIYQGVVGRPGVDFPVLTKIPATDFDCKKYGNGYFADLETDCQVFHICDATKKISFLCPNGTIFRQIDLICDWWFKVDCASAPGHYAESSEQLSRAQKLRQLKLKHESDIVTDRSIEFAKTTGGRIPQGRTASRSPNLSRRMDTSLENNSNENFDFDENIGQRRKNQNNDKFRFSTRVSQQHRSYSLSSSKETQEVAESGSFIRARNSYNGYNFLATSQRESRKLNDRTESEFSGYNYDKPQSTINPDAEEVDLQKINNNNNNNNKEDKLTPAETFNGYNYDKPKPEKSENVPTSFQKPAVNKLEAAATNVTEFNIRVPEDNKVNVSTANETETFGGYNYQPPSRKIKLSEGQNVSARQKSGNGSEDRNSRFLETSGKNDSAVNYFTNEPKPFNTRPTENTATTAQPFTTTASASTTYPRRGSTTYQNSKLTDRSERKQRIQTQNAINKDDKFIATTSDYKNLNTYSTARKPTTKTKETPFYTPTIPSIINRFDSKSQSTSGASASTATTTTTITTTTIQSTTTTPPPATVTVPTTSKVNEHVFEMMKTLQQLELETQTQDPNSDKYSVQRPGLEVPPSSGPNALHSLALYFATTTDGNTTTQATITEPKTTIFDTVAEFVSEENRPVVRSALLSQKTVDKYEALFNGGNKEEESDAETTTETLVNVNSRIEEEVNNDLEGQYSKSPIFAAAGSPQIRELAQVFTHALSAYLQDPETFRRILSEIRPTEPPALVETNQINTSSRFNANDELTVEEASYFLPKNIATTQAPVAATTDDLEVLDFSDVTLSTQKKDTTTTASSSDNFITSTTSAPAPTTTYSINSNGVTVPPLSSNLIDHAPASKLITDNLESIAYKYNVRKSKNIEVDALSNQTNNAIALEINGGLAISTQYPYVAADASVESANDTADYYALSKVNNATRQTDDANSTPESSTPIADTLAEIQSAPLRWGEDVNALQTKSPNNLFSPTVYPELLPPHQKLSDPLNDLLPNPESEEQLQRAQSQSIYASNNKLQNEKRKGKSYYQYSTGENDLTTTTTFLPPTTDDSQYSTTTASPAEYTTIKGHYITQRIGAQSESTTISSRTTLPDVGKFSPNSKTTLAYTVFLDPLTINDGLMDSFEDKTVTPNPNTYLPKDSDTEAFYDSTTLRPANSEKLIAPVRQGKSLNTTPLSIRFADTNGLPTEPEFMDTMQKRANDMFGSLNDTQADHLMHVMQKANENKTVRRLILLLIQTCDDDYNKTVEVSRQALLNALIGMDSKDNDANDIKIIETKINANGETNNRRGKKLDFPGAIASTTEAPTTAKATRTTTPVSTDSVVTTYRNINHDRFTNSKEYADISTTTSLYNDEKYSIYDNNNSNNELTTKLQVRFNDEYDEASDGINGYGGETTTNSNSYYDNYSTQRIYASGELITADSATEIPTTTVSTTPTTASPTSTASTTTTTVAPTIETSPSSSKRPYTTKKLKSRTRVTSNRVQKSLGTNEGFLAETSHSAGPAEHKHSDARALELLRSLYSLAARWG